MDDGSDGAGEVFGACPATLVEEEGEIDGKVEVDAEDVSLDGSAEADGGVEVGEPRQQRAALLIRRHTDVELDQVQHVGAHLQLQCADRASAGGRRRHDRWWDDRWGRGGAVRRAAMRHGGKENQVEDEEGDQLRRSHCRDRSS
ncbi:unnamed protein product [Alopecurus aequalis]